MTRCVPYNSLKCFSCILKASSGTSQVGARGKGKGKGSSATSSAATAGASSLAQYLCDSPQLKPDGKRQKGGTKACSSSPYGSADK